MKKIGDKYAIDGKFGVTSDGEFKIVNLVSGEAIPDDEPLFLLRGRDDLAVQTLNDYYRYCCSSECKESHVEAAWATLMKFNDFRNEHPESMKQPGITGHIDIRNSKL